MTRCAIPVAVFLAVTLGVVEVAVAQVSPEEHAKHHPGAGGPPANAGPGMAGKAGGMGEGGMGGMMEMMHGGPPAREPFPEMMNTPEP